MNVPMAALNKNPFKRLNDHNVIVPVLVRFDNANRPIHYIYINLNEFKIGRGLDNDEIIANEFISRAHCIFNKINENEWTITNLSSSPSGTVVNGQKLYQPHVIQTGDIIQLLPTPEFIYKVDLQYNEKHKNSKKHKLDKQFLIDTVKQKQETFAAHQGVQIKQMEEQIKFKEKNQSLIKERLDELMKNHEAVQGEFKEKNLEIKNLQDQIIAGNNQQAHLQASLTNLLTTLEEERQQFERLLSSERKKWQEEFNMTKQQKEQCEKDVEHQMKLWKDQQLTNIEKEKQALQLKLNQTENAFKEQQDLTENLQASLQNQQILLSGFMSSPECIVFKVDNDGKEQTIEILETIDLTNDNGDLSVENTQSKDEMMNAMDEQFTCSICSELFYKATTLSCSHTFCQYCINQWKKRRRECPICRTPLGSMNRALVLDNFIDEAVEHFSLLDRERRSKLIKDRDNAEMPLRQQIPNQLKPVKR